MTRSTTDSGAAAQEPSAPDPIRAQARAIAIATSPYMQGGEHHFPAFEDWSAAADVVQDGIERAIRAEVEG